MGRFWDRYGDRMRHWLAVVLTVVLVITYLEWRGAAGPDGGGTTRAAAAATTETGRPPRSRTAAAGRRAPAQAASSASNSRGSVPCSGCQSTPIRNRADGSSTPSIPPSCAYALTVSVPESATPWWW